MRPSIRFGLVVASMLALLGAPGASADTLPPTLTGEFFIDTPVSITATCNPGATSTMSFSANGIASGPYPGTFTETGTVTIGGTPTGGFVAGIPFYQVTLVDAVFTISSPVGQVTGTTQL